MPTRAEILAGLTFISNEWGWVAIGWHLAIAAALVALAAGWRPRPRIAGACIALLPASVAVFAVVARNPFNGMVFVALTVVLVALAMRDHRTALSRSPAWARLAGGCVIAFGWIYPHFLAGSAARYLYAAPVGLVPCPSLAVAIGFALLVGARRSSAIVLASAAAFYALFGVVRLGVVLDLGLFAGAVFLAVRARSLSR